MKKISGLILAAILVAGAWSIEMVRKPFMPMQPAHQIRLPRLAADRHLSAEMREPSGAPRAVESPRERSKAWADLERESAGRWQVAWTAGFISRMYGAQLPLAGSAAEAGKEFLAKYGGLIGLRGRQAALYQVRSMDGNTQVLYSQAINELPVFGSRINLIFDDNSNLIYLSAYCYGGAVPAPVPVDARVAARAAIGGLGGYFRRHLLPEPGISVAEMQARGRLGYRLSGEAIGLVYAYTVTQASPPLDLRIFVDGTTGELSDIRDLLKNK